MIMKKTLSCQHFNVGLYKLPRYVENIKNAI